MSEELKTREEAKQEVHRLLGELETLADAVSIQKGKLETLLEVHEDRLENSIDSYTHGAVSLTAGLLVLILSCIGLVFDAPTVYLVNLAITGFVFVVGWEMLGPEPYNGSNLMVVAHSIDKEAQYYTTKIEHRLNRLYTLLDEDDDRVKEVVETIEGVSFEEDEDGYRLSYEVEDSP